MTPPNEFNLNDRELATVLAALRWWQRGHFTADFELMDIATNGAEFAPLSDAEIDDLCEEMNR